MVLGTSTRKAIEGVIKRNLKNISVMMVGVKLTQTIVRKTVMKKGKVSTVTCFKVWVVIDYEIKLTFDEDDVLSYQTLVQIFDKRQAIKGIKKLKNDFKVRRRKLLQTNNMQQYKKIVMLYKKAIESKLEDNLKLILSKVNPIVVDYLLVTFEYAVNRRGLREAF